MKAMDRLIFALDVPNPEEAIKLCRLLKGHVGMFKVGLELFSSIGRDGLVKLSDEIGSSFSSIMLDLKLHDIPMTVKRTIRQYHSTHYGVSAMTVHTAGGLSMMRAAVEEAGHATVPIKIWAVTALTSMSPHDLQLVDNFSTMEKCVAARAKAAYTSGAHGIIASGKDLDAIVRSDPFTYSYKNSKRPCFITPGIRPAGSDAGDQQRVATPASAMQNGSDYLVVGRPIRDAPDPVEAADRIVDEITEALWP